MYFFFPTASAASEIYTLSLHDALPICRFRSSFSDVTYYSTPSGAGVVDTGRSEEHTSELQSHSDLVCRLLLEKKKGEPGRKLRMVLFAVPCSVRLTTAGLRRITALTSV